MSTPARKISAVPPPSPAPAVSDELALDLYYWMMLTRATRSGRSTCTARASCPAATTPAAARRRSPSAWRCRSSAARTATGCRPWIRDLGSYLVHGVPVWRMFAQFMGKAGSTTRGKDGNLHIGGREWNIPCQVSHMADMIPLTVGAALAYKQRGEERVALTRFGDAATSRGDFHEGLNIAAVLEVPAVFVAENNRWAYSTPISKQTKVTDLHKKALGVRHPRPSRSTATTCSRCTRRCQGVGRGGARRRGPAVRRVQDLPHGRARGPRQVRELHADGGARGVVGQGSDQARRGRAARGARGLRGAARAASASASATRFGRRWSRPRRTATPIPEEAHMGVFAEDAA